MLDFVLVSLPLENFFFIQHRSKKACFLSLNVFHTAEFAPYDFFRKNDGKMSHSLLPAITENSLINFQLTKNLLFTKIRFSLSATSFKIGPIILDSLLTLKCHKNFLPCH